MQAEPRTIVAVRPAAALDTRPRLFAALEAAFPVTFVAWRPDAAGAAATIVIDADPSRLQTDELARDGVPVFAVGAGTPVEAPTQEVTLCDEVAVDRRLRGVVLSDRPASPPLAPQDGEDVLAVAGDGAVWTCARGPAPVHRVRSVLPELAPEQVLYALLSKRAIAAVALIQFLRSLSGEQDWRPQPLRAAFVFDDPNLRWRSYGFIDYRRLLEHADAHGYHVAMAMIPLDAGRPHRATVSLFAERRDRLSLVVHGNDHVKRELLALTDAGSALAMAAQAMRRIERFERRSGLRVDRVMMPPHGLCSEDVSRALAAVGFDALSAIHPLPWTERPPASPLLAAWRPAEFVGGCAVIPRIPLTSTIADIALRAFLDHPMVIYGHHEDLAGGLEPLAEAAERVNRLGDVEWTSVGEIALSNYAQRSAGDGVEVEVEPYSCRLRVRPAAGARTLAVREPQPARGALEIRGWSIGNGPVRSFGAEAPLAQDGALEVRLHSARATDPGAVAAPAWRPWPKLRRAGTEMRDRALPLRPARAR